MGANTNIEWCHHTVNFWWGCEKVSPACAHCYAETLAKLFSRGKASWGATGMRWIRTAAAVSELRKLDASARQRGVVERVFINSMSDTFEDRPDLVAPRLALFEAAQQVTNLQLLLLTKRPEKVMDHVHECLALAEKVEGDEWPSRGPETEVGHWLNEWTGGEAPENLWVGTTVEDQTRANERIPLLLSIPAQVRFLSCEPLLGPVELSDVTRRSDCVAVLGRPALEGIHWIIAGGESGSGAWPMHPDWARSLRDQCAATGVPFHFKQWGEWLPRTLGVMPDHLLDKEGQEHRKITDTGEDASRLESGGDNPLWMGRVGKKAAGRLLDGRTHDELPAANREEAAHV